MPFQDVYTVGTSIMWGTDKPVDTFVLYYFGAILVYLLYDFYRLWRNPRGHWQQFVRTQKWIRAKGPGSILSLFEADPWDWENNPDKYILFRRVFNLIFIFWLVLMLGFVILQSK
jgi:hypothetical protein